MASGTTNIPKNGWTNLEVIHTETYGELHGCINPQLGIGFVKWTGNSQTSPTVDLSITIPNKYKPISNFTLLIRNGESMEVRSDNTVVVKLTGKSWSGAFALYPLA